VISEIGEPDKWVVVGIKSTLDTYFVCEIEDGERYANVLQLNPEINKRLVKVGKWDFGREVEVDDDGT
jgi:hypothetical protein